MTAAGAVFGSVLAGKVNRRWPFGKMLPIAYAIDAIIFLPILISPNIWMAATFWMLANAAATFEVSQILGGRLRVIPEEMVGRTFGAVRLFVLFGIAPGVLGFGWIADHVSPYAAMCASAFGFGLIAAIAIATAAIRNEAR